MLERRKNIWFACMFSFIFSKMVESHLYGEMTLENYGKIWCLGHRLLFASFNLLDENELKKCLIWIKLRPMYVKHNIIELDKIDMSLYLLQEMKANYFMKLNAQEG